MRKMVFRTKIKKKRERIFSGLTSYPLGGNRWGISPVYKTRVFEESVKCICLYNLVAAINNTVFALVSLFNKEVLE